MGISVYDILKKKMLTRKDLRLGVIFSVKSGKSSANTSSSFGDYPELTI